MDRRSFLALVAAGAVAGCTTTDSTTTSPAGQPPADTEPTSAPTDTGSAAATPADTATPRPELTLSAADAVASNPDVSLDIRYNYTRTARLPTDPPTAAEATQVWLMVKMAVENMGDNPRELTSHQYVVDADGETHEPVQTRADWALTNDRVAPGETATGWVPFQIPDYATSATLRVRDATRRRFAIYFDRDRNLDTTLPQ